MRAVDWVIKPGLNPLGRMPQRGCSSSPLSFPENKCIYINRTVTMTVKVDNHERVMSVCF